jgi:CO/xanthine dehydrogenase Mo-binding subunit
MAIATVLGMKPEQVEIETMLAGGSFGRRGEPVSDFAQELAGVAKAIGPNRPVKLVWTREDDIQGGRYRPIFLHRLRGAIRDGRITAWSNTIVGQSFIAGTPWEALRAVAELAGWPGPGPANNRARGVAVIESFGTYVAQIAEVSAGEGDGPRVHKVWCAVDCGIAVNPDVIRAQMESAIGYGLGHILFAEVALDEGRPVQSNFDTYRSLRIHEMPEVEVRIVNSSEKPTGVGEPGVPPIGPAVANAMARLGLQRPRRLPIVRGVV